MKYTNEPSAKTAIYYGCKQVDEFTDEINETCPMCEGEEIQRLRRVTGYLTGNYTTAFNKGKQQEVEYRVKHK
jgi:anaerobic ribonucleoside-triphosphate reductase